MAGRSTEESATRLVVDRALLPTRNAIEEVGEMMLLTGRTISSALRPPYPYGGEFVSQFLFVLRLVWFPLLVTTVAINDGAEPGPRYADRNAWDAGLLGHQSARPDRGIVTPHHLLPAHAYPVTWRSAKNA